MTSGNKAIEELEQFKVFDRPIIGYAERYYDGRDLTHAPSLQIGKSCLGSLFGLTWREGLTKVHRLEKPPIEYIEKGFWLHLFDGGSLYLEEPRKLANIAASATQATLCILNKKDNNLFMTVSVFFDDPSSGLTINRSKQSPTITEQLQSLKKYQIE